MRSTIAGFSGLLYFMIARTIAMGLFPEVLAANGVGRDIISTIVLGGALVTFTLVYWFYWKLRRLALPRKQRPKPPRTNRTVVPFPPRGRRGARR